MIFFSLLDLDLECHGLGSGGFVVGVSCCPDFNCHFVSALFQAFFDGHFPSLLVDLDLLVAGFSD